MNILMTIAQTLNATDLGIPKADSNTVLHNGLSIAYFVAGIVAVLVIIISGFTLVTAGSDPGTVTKAKNSILFAVIGLVIVILAAVITQFILGRAAAA